MSNNILFSSTRQWNPGDEFILFGIRNLLNDAGIKHNALIANRAPMLKQAAMPAGDKMPEYFDNSYIEHPMCDNLVDYVVMAGTPEWSGERLRPVFDLIKRKNLRFSFIGVGGRGSVPHDIMDRCDLVIVRDNMAMEDFSAYNPKHLPCPAMFASKEFTVRESFKNLGICFQGPGYCSAPNETMYEEIREVYEKLLFKHRTTLICHSIADAMWAKKHFPMTPMFYSSWAEDYLEVYRQFDMIVGTRIHGAGLASSMCIPSITIFHCDRCLAVKPFQSLLLMPNELLDAVESVDVAEISRNLSTHYFNMHSEYIELLEHLGTTRL